MPKSRVKMVTTKVEQNKNVTCDISVNQVKLIGHHG